MAFPDSWPYRRKITIKTGNLDASQVNFPLCVPILNDTTIGGRCLSTGYDIRFTDAAGVEIPYERESFALASGAATGVHWVKCNPSTAGTDIYVYYGNSGATDGADAENVWDANYAVVWHMNDATTSTILDSTSNDNDGTKKGANEPAEANGQVGKGQDFDGLDQPNGDYISSDSALLLPATTTYEAWFNAGNLEPAGSPNYAAVVGNFNNSAPSNGFNIIPRTTGIAVYWGTGSSTLAGSQGATLNAGTWYHVLVSHNGSAFTVYLNGASLGNITGAAGQISQNIIMGRWAVDYADYLFDGMIDEVRISDIVRSAEWIKFEYANMASADNELIWGPEESLIRVRRPHGAFNRPRR